MNITGQRMKERRQALGLRAEDIAKELQVSRATVFRYENGDVERLPVSILEPLAAALNTTPAYLMGWTDDYRTSYLDKMSNELSKQPKKHFTDNKGAYSPGNQTVPTSQYEEVSLHRIPILGRISAGLPLYAEENIEGYTYTDLNGDNEYFALVVKGDSMSAARILDGDFIIVRKQEDVDDGQIAVVMVNGEDATVKRFFKNGNTITLMPQSNNPEHVPQVYDAQKTEIRIIGRVVGNQMKVD